MVAAILKRAAIGFVMGMVVGVLIVVAKGFYNGGALVLPANLLAMTGSESGALLAQMLVSGAFGAIPMVGTVLYELDSWGLLKQAIVHFVSYTPIYVVLGTAMGWFEPTPVTIGVIVGFFAIGHTIIWLIMYLRYRAEVEQLDILLEQARLADCAKP